MGGEMMMMMMEQLCLCCVFLTYLYIFVVFDLENLCPKACCYWSWKENFLGACVIMCFRPCVGGRGDETNFCVKFSSST